MLHLFFDLWWFSYIQLFALMLQNREVVAWRKQFFLFFKKCVGNSFLGRTFSRIESLMIQTTFKPPLAVSPFNHEVFWCASKRRGWRLVRQLCFGNSTCFGDYGAWFGNCPEYVSETMVICFDVSRARNAGSGWDVKIQSREEASRHMGLKKTKYGEWDVKIQTCQEKGLPRARDVKGTPYEEKVETSEKDVKRNGCQRERGIQTNRWRQSCQQKGMSTDGRGRSAARPLWNSSDHFRIRSAFELTLHEFPVKARRHGKDGFVTKLYPEMGSWAARSSSQQSLTLHSTEYANLLDIL